MFWMPNLGAVVAGLFKAPDSPMPDRGVDIQGLAGGSASPTTRYGLPDHKWREVGRLSSGLPWGLKYGLLSANDVSNAKGDLQAMDAQVGMQKEYLSIQEKLFDRWKEVQSIQAELAKITMDGRLSIAQLDAKTAERYYQHMARMAVLQAENVNAQALAQTQQLYGVQLANHRLANSRKLLGNEFEEETRYSDAQYENKRQGLASRFRAKMDALQSPRSRPASEFEPTPNRILQFNRRAS
jgi:hypothetical protein